MHLIDDIIDLLSDDSKALQSALLKAQVLAHKLGDPELSKWVENELRGYPESAEVPPYRIVKLTVMGHITNGVYHYNNQVLGIQHLKEPLRTNLSKKELRDSISTIADWKDDNKIVITLPTEVCRLLSEPLSETYFVQQAWGKPSAGAFGQVMVQVRSRLLDFCLTIADKLPSDLSSTQIKERAEEVASNEIFRNALFGDNATIVIGSGQISNVSNAVKHNDFESLRKALEANGVTAADITDLQAAVADDASEQHDSGAKIGPKVTGWIARMLSKAGSGAWQVSITAAGALLGKAIGAYYGLGT